MQYQNPDLNLTLASTVDKIKEDQAAETCCIQGRDEKFAKPTQNTNNFAGSNFQGDSIVTCISN
jgi:hypothetical protein